MNREIKFRAWDNRSDNMFYPPMDIIGQMMVDELPEYVTFMQFTGLKDKNGKEIYEVDIVKDKFNHSWAVRYCFGMFGLYYEDCSNWNS